MRLALLAIVVTLAGASPASAGKLELDAFTAASVAIADAHWTARAVPPVPCPAAVGLVDDAIAHDVGVSEWSDLGGCRILISERAATAAQHALEARRGLERRRVLATYCAIIAHGRGHNRGLLDGHDDLMGKMVGMPSSQPWGCRWLARLFTPPRRRR